MNRSRLVLLLTGLALAICVVALTSSPKALATVPQAKLMFAPSPANAGVVHTGFTSTTSVKVFNASGTVSAHITGVAINPPFSIAPNGDQCTGQTLGPAQSCNVTVQFAPGKKGKFSQALKVTVTASKTVFKVSVTGSGSLTAPTTPTPSPSPTPSPTPTIAPTSSPTPAVAPTSAGDIFLLGGYATVPVIYDPAQQTFNNSGGFDSFTGGADGDVLPENYRSVSLPTGQILIAGGDNGTNAFANAYIYDPATQTVTPTTPMHQARTQFTLTVLNNGQVLAVGGSPTWVDSSKLTSVSGSTTLQSAEIYDPIAKTWTTVASLAAARLAHAATLMPDGTVLITGGLSYNAGSSAYSLAQDTEVYNPTSNSWASTSITLTSVPRFNHASVLLDDGTVLLVGGQNVTSAVANLPVHYFTNSQSWGTVPPENTPRYGDAVTKLANGDILIAGGIDGSGNQLNTGEVFQLSGLSWTTIQNTLPDAASGQTATLMPDGRVIIAGGTSPTVATFDHSTNSFAAGGSLPSAFAGAGSTALVVQSALNVLPVGVGPGILTAPTPGFQNVPYVSVKVCVPGTSQCRVVDGVVLDTGSTGLRLFASKLQGADFTPLTSGSTTLGECAGFVSGVAWGPLVQADIYMGGDIAKGQNFQIIDDLGAFSPIPASCPKNFGATTVFSSPLLRTSASTAFSALAPSPRT